MAAAPAPRTALSVDLDGDGRLETVEAEKVRVRVRVLVRDARGRRVASAAAPAPSDGQAAVSVTAGELGSAGALLEVTASSPSQVCRSFWRMRSGKLQALPIRSPAGPLSSCEARSEWTTRFERDAADTPARYLRERTRVTSRGEHKETQVFRFAGFHLELVESRGEIAGVSIPDWYDALFYPQAAIEALFERFDLTPLRQLPRLSVHADLSDGAFSLRFYDGGAEIELPVRSSSPGPEGSTLLRVDGPGEPVEVAVRLAGDVPYEIVVRGLSERLDGLYAPVSRIQKGAFRVYPNAAAELTANGLPGTWSTEARQTVTIAAAPGALDRIQVDRQSFAVDLDRAPAGLDVLLVPEREQAPSWALDLRGPHAVLRVPVRCPAWPSRGEPSKARCEGTGPGETLRRLGARIDLR
ncbi:MAG: hypothetical protein ABR576_12820 [Thermoanaerobaculia bacterium]